MKPSTRGYHSGEIEVQRRAGVREEADAVGRIIDGRMPPGLLPLLPGFRMAVAASIDARGRVWASLLTGPPGFLKAVSESRLHVAARPAAGDPFLENLAGRPEVGLVIFDPATRRRLRVNGEGAPYPGGSGFSVETEQVYGNCRKYIQQRRLQEEGAARGGVAPATGRDVAPGVPPDAPPAAGERSRALSPRQRTWIAAADTFFIASAHPHGGADASHRGGRPGFVQVAGSRRLSFPDYPGNNMYNTLGNLAGDPRAGLLFVDFDGGGLLQVTGHARLVWEPEAVAARAGAHHVVVEYEIDEVFETHAGANALRWTLVEPSPFNP